MASNILILDRHSCDDSTALNAKTELRFSTVPVPSADLTSRIVLNLVEASDAGLLEIEIVDDFENTTVIVEEGAGDGGDH